ncbi:MAG: FdtA/QdtA family cupin domain-containing protein [Clostridiaceae bacterium]
MNFCISNIRTIESSSMGSLSFFEGARDLPFVIKRIYYIYDVPKGTCRGGHAHKELSQILFCPYGKVQVTLDDGAGKQVIILDTPDKGLLIGPGLWRDMLWLQSDSVLCVAASDYYDEADYIRDYDEFISVYGGKHES